MDVDELMEEYDAETSKIRKLRGPIAQITTLIAIAMAVFQFYTGGFGTLVTVRQRSLHIIFAFTLGLLLYPATKKSKKDRATIIDFALIALTVVVFGYLFINVEQIAHKGTDLNTIDMVFGAMAILLTLEVTRRVVGPELPIVAIIFLAYAKLGPYMPGMLAHRGFALKRIVSHMYLALEGILGIPLGV